MKRSSDAPSASQWILSTLTSAPLRAVRRSAPRIEAIPELSLSRRTSGGSQVVSHAATRFLTGIRNRLRAVSFWLAVGLPWLLLAGLLGGVVTSRPVVLAALVAVTVLSAFAGHEHATEP